MTRLSRKERFCLQKICVYHNQVFSAKNFVFEKMKKKIVFWSFLVQNGALNKGIFWLLSKIYIFHFVKYAFHKTSIIEAKTLHF